MQAKRWKNIPILALHEVELQWTLTGKVTATTNSKDMYVVDHSHGLQTSTQISGCVTSCTAHISAGDDHSPAFTYVGPCLDNIQLLWNIYMCLWVLQCCVVKTGQSRGAQQTWLAPEKSGKCTLRWEFLITPLFLRSRLNFISIIGRVMAVCVTGNPYETWVVRKYSFRIVS